MQAAFEVAFVRLCDGDEIAVELHLLHDERALQQPEPSTEQSGLLAASLLALFGPWALLYHLWSLSLFLGKFGIWNLGQSLSEHEGTDDETHTIRAVFTVHSKTEAPAPSAKPSRVRVYPGKVVRPGQLIVVAARDVGVRGRLRWDYKDMDTGFDRRPGLHQRFHGGSVAPQRSDVESGLADRISVGNSSSRLQDVLDRHDVISLSSSQQRVLLPLEDLRGTDADTVRTASKSKKRPPTSITLGDDSCQ